MANVAYLYAYLVTYVWEHLLSTRSSYDTCHRFFFIYLTIIGGEGILSSIEIDMTSLIKHMVPNDYFLETCKHELQVEGLTIATDMMSMNMVGT